MSEQFDYLGTGMKIYDVVPWLARFESPQIAKQSTTMDEVKALMHGMSLEDFLVSVGVALSFNVTDVPADHVVNNLTPEYLLAHPEMQKQLDGIEADIEKLRDESTELLEP